MPPCSRLAIFNRYCQQNISFHSPLGLIRAPSLLGTSFCQPSRHYAGGIGRSGPGQIDLQAEDADGQARTERDAPQFSWRPTLFKMFESAATTFASILVLGMAGYGYHRVRRFWD